MRRRLYTYTVYLAYIYVQSGHHYESFSLLLSLSSFIIRQTFIQVRYIYVCMYIHIYWNYVVVSFLFLFLFLLLLYLLPAWYYILQYTSIRCVVVVALSRFVDIDKKFIILTWFTCCCCFFLHISLLLLLFLFRCCICCCFLILFYFYFYPKLRYLSIYLCEYIDSFNSISSYLSIFVCFSLSHLLWFYRVTIRILSLSSSIWLIARLFFLLWICC